MGEIKKELTKVQYYAVKAASDKAREAYNELQSILQMIADELGIDREKEKWRITADMKYFERMDAPQPKAIIPKKNKGKKKK